MLPSHAEWRALTELCAEAGVTLFADEVYRFLEYDEADRLPAGRRRRGRPGSAWA